MICRYKGSQKVYFKILDRVPEEQLNAEATVELNSPSKGTVWITESNPPPRPWVRGGHRAGYGQSKGVMEWGKAAEAGKGWRETGSYFNGSEKNLQVLRGELTWTELQFKGHCLLQEKLNMVIREPWCTSLLISPYPSKPRLELVS